MMCHEFTWQCLGYDFVAGFFIGLGWCVASWLYNKTLAKV